MLSSVSFRQGVSHAFGVPALGLGSSMFAFGAYLKSAGFDLFQSIASTLFTFALPGQFVMAETMLAGGTFLNIFFAVLLTNARLFPMTANLVPIIRNPSYPKWKLYLLAHFIAVTSWFNMFAVHKNLQQKNKFDYFLGLGGYLWFNAVICTMLGFSISHLVSHELLIGLVFINPTYFLIMTVSNLNEKKLIASVILGAIFSIGLFRYIPEWSVLIAGISSGTLGFFIFNKENK